MTTKEFRTCLENLVTGKVYMNEDGSFELISEEGEDLRNWESLAENGFSFPDDGEATKGGYHVFYD